MKVKELITKLQEVDPELEICLYDCDEGRHVPGIELNVTEFSASTTVSKWYLEEEKPLIGKMILEIL